MRQLKILDTMTIKAKYDPKETEDKWYKYWMEQGYFKSQPDQREPYTIVIPPPNVTGVLHMGHILNNSIQDILIRRSRMQGKNACWVPGTDHASIATEAKVVAMLKEKGIDKKNITREQFLEYAWQWKEKHGGIILEQLKKLGASCDWSRTKFTMDPDMYESVIDVFIDLYNKGLIYRGVRMINWDPKALTAISDEEVIFKEVNSKLYYIRYKIEESDDEWINIATTRPETILGDTAICVHPEDERYKHLRGKKAVLPLLNRSLPIIFDEYVDKEFGTGALKVTPCHDINDYNLGIKYKLEFIDIFNDNGTLNANAGLFIGEDRFKARKLMIKKLEETGFLVKTEELINKVGYSERTDEVIEPKLSMQWFLKMPELSKPALDKVMDDTVRFHPAKFKNTYKHWFDNVKDWCISRQLWWGQRIPAYYLPNGNFVIAKSKEEALEKALNITGVDKQTSKLTLDDLRQDEDVLDTWFSSWLWPISVFDGIRNPDNADIKYYYPSNDLITAPEILFFWVARMIMAGYEYRQDKPFSNVYLTGLVRDMQHRKMSKSLGNSPEPLDLIDKYSADGIRIGMLFSSPAGNDLLFDEALCEQGRNFCNKLWNAFRLIKSFDINEQIAQPEHSAKTIEWFTAKLNETINIVEDHYSKFRISDVLMTLYKFVWDDFCSWYLEIIKPEYQQAIDLKTWQSSICFLEKILKLLHPLMPFITEEIWQLITERTKEQALIISAIPQAENYDIKLLSKFDLIEQIITEIRNIRKEKNIPQKDSLQLFIKKNNDDKPDTHFDCIISKLCNLNTLSYTDKKVDDAVSFIVKATEFFIPLSDKIDIQSEIKKLKEELHYTEGFLKSVKAKLNNEKFAANAPANIIDNERKKEKDALERIAVIKEQLLKYES